VTLRAVFAGTPDFAIPSLEVMLDSDVEVCAVYTQPDRPAGRGRKLRASPVKELALRRGLTLRQPADLDTEAPHLSTLDIDLMVVVAYGLILPRAVLTTPRLGCINVHASLLPRWRGAAPIQRAIEAGDTRTGVTLMQMDEGLDTGPVLVTADTLINECENSGSLHNRLATLGAQALRGLLARLHQTPVIGTPQAATGACYAQQLTRAETWLDWRSPAEVLERRIRAFNPWPLARSRLGDMDYLIRRARAKPSCTSADPGMVLAVQDGLIQVQTGNGALELLELQRPGGKALDTRAFLHGHPIKPGSIFTTRGADHAQR
jgi:methionyl-tRNA formyltransferase